LGNYFGFVEAVSAAPLVIEICQKILLEHNLKIKLHAYGTNIEGDLDNVFRAIKKCHKAVHGKARRESARV
jgi:uncharacterized protein (TIGR00106 family)